MKERPILMSAPMVRALLSGTKTQTRREFKAKNGGVWPRENDKPGMQQILRSCPYGQPGDRLWVRETWGYFDPDCSGYEDEIEDRGKGPGLHCAPEMMQEGHPLRDFWRRRVAYAATWEEPKFGNGPDKPSRWRPSIHMPRWASRITLEVTGVRVERLGQCSEADATAEGVGSLSEYRDLWKMINGQWEPEKWVWVIQFRRV